MTDAHQEAAALEEIADKLEEALQNIESALAVLTSVGMGADSDAKDLFERVFAAQEATQAASEESQRRSSGLSG